MKALFFTETERRELFELKSFYQSALDGINDAEISRYWSLWQENCYSARLNLCDFFTKKLSQVKTSEQFQDLFLEFRKIFGETDLVNQVEKTLDYLVEKFLTLISTLRKQVLDPLHKIQQQN